MSRMIIVEGDYTTSGGRVLTGSQQTDIDGFPVARVNDKCTCPQHKGTFPIVTGYMTFMVDGQLVARHGDKLACGCALVSTRQFRVFLDEMTGNNPSADAAMFGAAAAAAAASAAAEPAEPTTHVHSDGAHTSPPDPAKARDVVTASNNALLDADAYRVYDTELEAAKAWAGVVLPIANSPEFGVEVGANISRVNGKYVLGTAYSTGSKESCDDLPQNGHKVAGGRHTAYIHTHPAPYGGTGRNRAYTLGQLPDKQFPEGIHGRPQSGWDIGPGDYDTAYTEKLNAYVAEPGTLLAWNYQRYVQLQLEAQSKNSLADPAVELGKAEARH